MQDLAKIIDAYIEEHGDIAPQTWYTLWHTWLRSLQHVNPEGAYFHCDQDDVLYPGSSSHMMDHPNAFGDFLTYAQQRITDWLPTMIAVVEKHRLTPLEVHWSSSDLYGESVGSSFTERLPALLNAHLWNGRYLRDVPYTPELNDLLLVHDLTVYYDAAKAQFAEQLPYNVWSDMALIFDPLRTISFPSATEEDDHYRWWQSQRANAIFHRSWEDLPVAFRERTTWKKLLTWSFLHDSGIDLDRFGHLPVACQDVLRNMKQLYATLMDTFHMDQEQSIELLLSSIPGSTRDALDCTDSLSMDGLCG